MERPPLTNSREVGAAAVLLSDWIVEHGPLSPTGAFLIGLETCARISRVASGQLASAVQTLSVMHVSRGSHGGWSWTPVLDQVTAGRVVSDSEIIERIAAMIWHGLTGQPVIDPYAGASALRTMLRGLRPDVPAVLADLTVRAVSARGRQQTLAAFASEIREVLGLEVRPPTPPWYRTRHLAAAAICSLSLVVATAWMAATDRDRVQEHGLTTGETEWQDVIVEAAQSFAVVDEHTAAIQEYQHLTRLLGARLAPADPRLFWNGAQEAWVRRLAGDNLTTEQWLSGGPEWLTRELGDTHPYTRVASLALAQVLEDRGAKGEAAALRSRARQATHRLLRGQVAAVLSAVIPPSGVIAHVAPNHPIREGFRRDERGMYFAPLTSVQRLTTGRSGWRVHIVGHDTCHVGAVIDDPPRRVSAALVKVAGGWDLTIDGVIPRITLPGVVTDTPVVSISGDSAGNIVTSFGDQKASGRVNSAEPIPVPPHALSFNESEREGACAVVWMEIPLPFVASGR